MRHSLKLLRSFWLWPSIMVAGLTVLVALPGGFADKSKFLLHGLCAQTPGHTLVVGGQPLPFDARMTGIYLGTLMTLLFFAWRGRLLSQDIPPMPVLILLIGSVLAMGLDGFNSLLTDIGHWHPWESSNLTRLVTGYIAGISLATALVWLLAGTVFHLGDRRPSMASIIDLVVCLIPLPVFYVLMLHGPGWIYWPVATPLIFSAWIVLASLATVTLLLITMRDEHIFNRLQLHVPGAIGLVAGIVLMLALAAGRQWLERTLGVVSTF